MLAADTSVRALGEVTCSLPVFMPCETGDIRKTLVLSVSSLPRPCGEMRYGQPRVNYASKAAPVLIMLWRNPRPSLHLAHIYPRKSFGED